MTAHVDCYYKIQAVMALTATQMLTFSERLTVDVVEPLNAFFKEGSSTVHCFVLKLFVCYLLTAFDIFYE